MVFEFTSWATTLADETNRPNVLFIGVDDLNAWAMGLSDYSAAATPNMNRLAKRGVVFSNAHCAAPACNPSRVSVMTSVSPSTSGVYLNGQDWRECSRLKGLTTLPKLFREHGYEVKGGGKLYHAANLSKAGLEGFLDAEPWHEYFPSKSRQLADEFVPAKHSVNGSNDFYGGRFDWNALDIDDAEMGDAKVVAWARGQLSQKHDKPLFLGVGIYRPHIPWYTPKKWFDKYPLNAIQLPKTLTGDIDDIPAAGQEMSKHAWHQWLVHNNKWPEAVQAYLASVSFADAMVGELIDALDNGPLAGNTIVVLWSDHGYHLGHKQHWEKRVLWEQATRVPLVIADRRIDTAGRRCDRPVSLLDVYPTLADLCDLDSPKHVEGQSLKPLLVNPLTPSERAVVTTQAKGNHAVRSQNWRYIRYADGSEELYDHRNDPQEFHNLADKPGNSDVIKQLAVHLPATDAPMDPVQKSKAEETEAIQRVVVSLAGDRRLDVFGVDAEGRLKLETQTSLDGGPSASLFDQTGRHLYVATATPDAICVLKTQTDGFKQVQSVAVDAKPSYLAIDPTGRFLLASYYKTGQVTVHRIIGEGRLSEQPVQKLTIDPRAHSVAIDPSGKCVFVSHTATNSITQFRFDNRTGKLELNSPARLQRDEKTGPRHLWFHPSGKFAYGSDESGRSISAYQFNSDNGTLKHLQSLSSFPKSFEGKGTTSRVQVHPSGKVVYIANRSEGSIAVFGIDQTSGRLRLLQRTQSEPIVRGFNFSPDGRHLIAAGQQSGNLVSYRIDNDGLLDQTSKLAVGGIPWWVTSFPSLSESSSESPSTVKELRQCGREQFQFPR